MTSFATTTLTVEQFRIVESILNEDDNINARMATMQKYSGLFWNMVGLNNVRIFMLNHSDDRLVQEFSINFLGRLIFTCTPKQSPAKALVGAAGCFDAIVRAMTTHTDSARVQLLGYHVLVIATSDTPENARRIGDTQGFDDVAQRLVRAEVRGEAAIDGLLLLGNVAKYNPRCRARFRALGIPGAVAGILRSCAAQPPPQRGGDGNIKNIAISGLRALGALFLDRSKENEAPVGMVKTVLDVMARFKDELVNIKGSYALASIAGAVRCKEKMLKEDAVDIVLQIIAKNAGNTHILDHTVAFLDNVCGGYLPPETNPATATAVANEEEEKRRKKEMLEAKMGVKIKDTDQGQQKDGAAHQKDSGDNSDESDSTSVEAETGAALTVTTADEDTVERIAAADGFKIIARAMGKNTRAEKVQVHGCSLLGKLARCKGTDYSKAVDLIGTAMGKHGSSVAVQTSALYGITQVMSLYNTLLRQQQQQQHQQGQIHIQWQAVNNAVQAAMGISKTRVGANFIKPTFKAMGDLGLSKEEETAPTTASLLREESLLALERWGCAALMELGKHCRENKALMRGCNIDLVLGRLSTTDEQTLANALTVLNYMTANDTRAKIGSKGTVEALVGILGAHHTEAVASHCLKAIANVVGRNSSNRAALRDNGGIEAVVHSIAAYATCASVAGRGAQVLEAAVDNSPPSKARIRDIGGIPLLAESVRRHAKAPKHLARIITSIAAIVASNAENATTVADAGGVGPIIVALKAWPRHLGVQHSCCHALAALAGSGSAVATECLVGSGALEASFDVIRKAPDAISRAASVAAEVQAYAVRTVGGLCGASKDARDKLLATRTATKDKGCEIVQYIINIVARRASFGGSGSGGDSGSSSSNSSSSNNNSNDSDGSNREEDLGEAALQAIAEAAGADERLQREFAACGGGKRTVALLKAAQGWNAGSAAPLIASGLRALESILRPVSKVSTKTKTSANQPATTKAQAAEEVVVKHAGATAESLTKDAIELSITLIAKYREYRCVVEAGIHLLTTLAPCGNEPCLARARAAKAPEAILRALRKHIECMGLQELGLSALAVLTAPPRPIIVAPAPFTSSMSSIPQQQQQKPQRPSATLATSEASGDTSASTSTGAGSNSSLRDFLMLIGSSLDATTVPEERAVDYSDENLCSLLGPMRRYPESESIQADGCTVLRNLARCNDKYKSAVGSDSNDSAALLLACVQNMSERVVLAALRELSCVTYNSAPTCARLLAAEDRCVVVVATAMLRHAASSDVQRYGWHTLANLAYNSPDAVTTGLCCADSLRGLVEGLAAHTAAAGVVRTANYALALIAQSGAAAAEATAAAGGIEAVVRGLEAHPDDEEVQRWGLNALSSMTRDSVENQKRVAATTITTNTTASGGTGGGGGNSCCGGIEVLVRAIKAFPANEGIQEDGCAVIGRVSTVDAAAAKHVESSIGVRAIVRTITMYAASAKIQEFALQALANISEGSPEVAAGVARSDGIEAIVATLKKYATSTSIVRLGLLVLANVVGHSADTKARLERCRGVEQVLAALAKHTLDSAVQRNGCAALSAAALDCDTVKRRVDEAGGVRTIVSCTLRNFSDHPDVLAQGFLALANAADNSTRIQKAVDSCNAIDAVLAEMDRYSDVQLLQEAGLKALAAFTQFSTTASAKIAKSHYGIPGIFTALRSFGDQHQPLALYAARTLTHMSGNTNRSNVAAIVRCDGVGCILKLMGRYPQVPQIQRYCIVILTNVSLFPENTRQVTNAGAIAALVAAMNRFKPSNAQDSTETQQQQQPQQPQYHNRGYGEEVQRAGIIAVECIVTRTQNVAALHLEDSGVIQAIVDGMTSGAAAYNEYVLRSACVTFTRIAAGNPANAKAICAAGGVGEMLEAVMRYPENLEIQNLVVNALGNIALSGGTEAQNVIWSKGGAEAVIQSMREGIKNYAIQEQCCFALSAIGSEVPDIKAHIINSGGLVVIAAAMDKYGKIYEVQSSGCLAIARITGDVKMAAFPADKVPDVSAQILSAMTSFGERKDIQRAGCLAIANVARGREEAIGNFIDAGAPKVIIRAMGLHPTVVQVQECACKALSILASPAGGGRRIEPSSGGGGGGSGGSGNINSSGGGSGGSGNINSSGGSGGGGNSGGGSACVDAVLGAMNRHQTAAGVQYYGCRALAALTRNAAQNQVAIGNGGGIEAILRAATQFPDYLKLQRYACAALTALTCENIPNLIRFCTNDGINVVATSMNRFATDPTIQLFSLRVLFNTLAMEGGPAALGPHIYAVIKAAAEFTQAEDIEDLAMWLIASMIGSEVNLEAAGCPECIRAVAAALPTHLTSPSVRRNGCFIFSRLASASHAFARIIADNCGVDAVIKAASADKTQETLGLAASALRDIARVNSAARKKVELCGGVDVLVAAANASCGTDQGAVEDSCIAIEYIISPEDSDYVKDYTKTSALAGFFSRITTAYPLSPVIQQAVMCSRREPPQRTVAATEDGFCSNVALDRCNKPRCPWYCPECNTPQWAYICETCKGTQNEDAEDAFWCEVCWKKHHAGHKGARVFLPCHCACTEPRCQEMQLAYMGTKGVSRWIKSIGLDKSVAKAFMAKHISGKIIFALTGKQIVCLGVSVRDAIIIQNMVASIAKQKAASGNDSTCTKQVAAAPPQPAPSESPAEAPKCEYPYSCLDTAPYKCFSKLISLGDIYADQQKSFYMSLNNAMIASGFGPLFPEIQEQYKHFIATHPGVEDLLQSGALSSKDAISIFIYTSFVRNNCEESYSSSSSNNNSNDDDELPLVTSPYVAVNDALKARIGVNSLSESVELTFLNLQGYLMYLLSGLRKLAPCTAERRPFYCGVDGSSFDGLDNFARVDESFVWPSFAHAYSSEEVALEVLKAVGAKKPVIFEISGKCFGHDVTPFTSSGPVSRTKVILLEPETKFRVVSTTKDEKGVVKRVCLDIIKTPLLLLDQVKMFHLNAPLPEDWISNYDTMTNKIYYENRKTGLLQWKNPLDVPLSDIFNF